MAPRRMFHPVTPGWKDSGRLVVIIKGIAYRTLNSYSTFGAAAIQPESVDRAIARGHQILEKSPESLPEFMREGSVDEIYEAFLDPDVAVLATEPVGEQIHESITVRNHPGLSIGQRTGPKSDTESDSDSDMGSDNTAIPARPQHLSPTTAAEDALGTPGHEPSRLELKARAQGHTSSSRLEPDVI
ncbi:hypothetical protein BGX38DRAFT_1326123 [Terfezia claveryi]|nr:hypothetical protein BGX38DRAFT_1326123 [Terfezia claveryi]